ncbi:Fic family protein [Capnocytophaga sputigena]
MIESKKIEYKRQVTPELEKEVVAFLNTNEGGFIYIGIDKTGKTIGVPNPDAVQLELKDRFKNNILPSCMGLFDILLEKRNDKNVIKIIVAGGYEKPYYIKKYGLSEKGTFIRIGSASEPMPSRQIEELFTKRTRYSIGKIKSPKKDLRFQQLQIYYQSMGKTLNEQFARNLELLNEDGDYNYVAYLMNDINNISVRVARYAGTNQVDLIQNEEYGHESLIKATQQVLDKLNLENRTFTKITYKQRIERRLWNPVALREAVINAFVHNDYTYEVAPKFEIFKDRLVITSCGGLPYGISQEEFFSGTSIPRNKELMRIFRDVELVEHLGSGIPRILQSYPKESFKFMENTLRVIFPIDEDLQALMEEEAQDTMQVPSKYPPSTPQVTPQVPPKYHASTMQAPCKYHASTMQVTMQVKDLLNILEEVSYREEIQEKLGLKNRDYFRKNYLNPAIEQGFVALTIPDKPTSSKQQYYLTDKGKEFLKTLK